MMIFPTIDKVLLSCCNTQFLLESVVCIHLLQNFIKKPKLQKHHAYFGFYSIILFILNPNVEMDVTIVIVAQNNVRMTIKSSQMDKVTSNPLPGSLPHKACLLLALNDTSP
jgi:hypothetical protein